MAANGSIIMQKSWMKLISTERKAKPHRDYFRGIFLIGKLGKWSSKNVALFFFIFFLSFHGLIVKKKEYAF